MIKPILQPVVSQVLSAIGNSEPKTRFAPKFDGVTTYIKLDTPTEVTYESPVSITIIGLTEANPTRELLNYSGEPSSDTINVFLHDNGIVYVRNGSNQVFGSVSIDGGDFELYPRYPTDGGKHQFTFRPHVGNVLLFDEIIKSTNLSSGRDLTLLDLIVGGEIFPLDEPFTAYPILTGSLGGTATAYNFVETDVVEIVK